MIPLKRSGTLVIQPFPGIGDIVWCLPLLRALKRRYGPLTLLTKSRSGARDWLMLDGTVQDVVYAERRFLLGSIVPIIKGRFERSIILHRSYSYALLPFLAMVPERLGFGYGAQKNLLTHGPFLDLALRKKQTVSQLAAFADAHDLILDPDDYAPPVCGDALRRIQNRLEDLPRPFITLGIGGSEPTKKWPAAHFAELAKRLGAHHNGTLFICGSGAERPEALKIASTIDSWGGQAHVWTDLSLREMCAFLSLIDLYVGNDTGPLNMAAGFKKTAIGLFGTTPPLSYLPNLSGVVCPYPNFRGKDAMAAITPLAVESYIVENGFLNLPMPLELPYVS